MKGKRMSRKIDLNILWRSRKKIIVAAILLCVLGLSLLYTYIDYVVPKMGEKRCYMDTGIGEETLEISENNEITQVIPVAADTIDGVSVAFNTEKSKLESKVRVSVICAETSELLGEWLVEISELNHNEYSSFYFSQPIVADTGKNYYLNIEAEDTAYVYTANDALRQSKLICNGEYIEKAVAYQVFGGTQRSLKYAFAVIALGMFVLLVIIGIVVEREVKVEGAFLKIALVVGMLYMFIIPPYAVPDEEAHFVTVYAKSSMLQGNMMQDEDGNTIARPQEVSYYARRRYPNSDTYVQYLKGVLGIENIKSEGEVVLLGPMDITGMAYMPQILGVSTARILQLNGVQLLFMGRMFAWLFYITVIFYAIRLMPFAKETMFVIALLPMSVQQGMSYSYDVTLNALAFFVFSYTLFLIYEKPKVQKRDIAMLSMAAFVLSPIKIVYIVIFGIGLLIPYEKFGGKNKKYLSAVIILVSGIGAILFTRISSLTSVTSNVASSSWSGESGYTLSYLLSHPIDLFGIFYRSFERQMSFYWESLIGYEMGWLEIQLPIIILIIFSVLLLLSGLRCEEDKVVPGMKAKAWMLFLALTCMAGVCMAMLLSWTRGTARVVEGVQGRYFLPVLPMLMLLVANGKVVLKKKPTNLIVFGVGALQLYCVLSMVQTVISR